MKIYLSKSNRCNPNHVMTVRQFIKDEYKNTDRFELLEHEGGPYQVSKLLEADAVFMVSEAEPIETEDKFLVDVGRGTYSEAVNYLDKIMKHEDEKHLRLFYCKFDEDGNFALHIITGAKITNMDNWIRYGKISFRKEPDEIVLPEKF